MKTAHSPLFEPVLWEGEGFKILDETLLPEKTEYITVSEFSQALRAVAEMKTRAFGQVLTFLFSAALLARSYKESDPEPLARRLAEMTQQFCAARPTFDFKGLGRSFAQWFQELPRGAAPGAWVESHARRMAERIVKAREARAERTAELLPAPARILTHCNISGELVAVARRCEKLGKEISVIATETRPYLQGSRLTAWELSQAGVAVSIIPDCAIAQVMARGEANVVVVGSDRCAQNGDIINKVGTYPLALMAQQYGVPFYALVQDPGGLARGDDIEIEERPVAELLSFQGRALVPEGANKLAGRYPAFDVTPARLIARLIGFDDWFTPESFRERFQRASPKPENGEKNREKYVLVYGLPQRSSYTYLSQTLKAEQAERILVPEMRPELWGVHEVARALLERNLPATLISDNMMGTLFAHGQVRRLFLFYSGLDQQGPRGICGSLLAVQLARAHRVPTELLEAEEPALIPADRDVGTFLGQPVGPPGVAAHTVGREVVPWDLFKEEKETGL